MIGSSEKLGVLILFNRRHRVNSQQTTNIWKEPWFLLRNLIYTRRPPPHMWYSLQGANDSRVPGISQFNGSSNKNVSKLHLQRQLVAATRKGDMQMKLIIRTQPSRYPCGCLDNMGKHAVLGEIMVQTKKKFLLGTKLMIAQNLMQSYLKH